MKTLIVAAVVVAAGVGAYLGSNKDAPPPLDQYERACAAARLRCTISGEYRGGKWDVTAFVYPRPLPFVIVGESIMLYHPRSLDEFRRVAAALAYSR